MVPASLAVGLCGARDIADFVEAVLTSLALLLGGAWSYALFVKKRQKYPRANLTHAVSHRAIGDGKIVLNVAATISNGGDVLLSILSAETRVEQLCPPPPGIEDTLMRAKQEQKRELEWPVLAMRVSDWQQGEFQIEPGESDQLYYDFVIEDSVKTVKVYTYFRNFAIKGKNREIGWNVTTVYDLSPSEAKGG